jgi:hypothetical protein
MIPTSTEFRSLVSTRSQQGALVRGTLRDVTKPYADAGGAREGCILKNNGGHHPPHVMHEDCPYFYGWSEANCADANTEF